MGKTATKTHFLILLIVTTLYLLTVLLLQWETFSITYPLSEYEYRYSQSQYVLGENRTQLLGDGDIYTYAGIRYMAGESPTSINFEHPPLIKYLFGASYVTTGMPNWVLIPLFYLALISFWYCANQIIDTQIFRWLALILFLAHSSIYSALPQTMLDFPMTTFMLVSMASYLFYLKHPTRLNGIFLGISSGLFLLSKYPFPLSFLLTSMLYLSLLIRTQKLKQLLIISIATCATYLIGYIRFFTHGNSLIEFIRFEWWRWNWFSGKTDSPKGMIWQTIFLGKYPMWWTDDNQYISLNHWNLLWPVSLILYLASWIKKQVRNNTLFAYQLWIIVALIAYSFGAAEDRFLIPLIPGFALFGARFLERLGLKHHPVR